MMRVVRVLVGVAVMLVVMASVLGLVILANFINERFGFEGVVVALVVGGSLAYGLGATDGGTTLAADRMSTLDGCKNGRVTKIRRTADGRLLGAAGWTDGCNAFMDWLESGGDRPAFQTDTERGVQTLEIMPNGTVWRHGHSGQFKIDSVPVTLGSGSPYAMAALLCGKDAKGAVEIACQLDESSAGPVDVLVLHPGGANHADQGGGA